MGFFRDTWIIDDYVQKNGVKMVAFNDVFPPSYLKYWGKADKTTTACHLLAFHQLDCAAVARALLERGGVLRPRLALASGLDESFVQIMAPFFAGLHDIGKFAVPFQNLRPDVLKLLADRVSVKPYHHRHDVMGVEAWSGFLIDEWLGKGWFDLDGRSLDRDDFGDIIKNWADASGGHHGRPPERPPYSKYLLNEWFEPQDKEALLSYAIDLAGLFSVDAVGFPKIDLYDLRPGFQKSSWTIAGLIVIADWIASNPTYFPHIDQPMFLDEYWGEAKKKAVAAIEQSGLTPSRHSAATGFRSLFPEIGVPSPLQQFASECVLAPGAKLFILEDATGSGKTEASMVLAHRLMAAGEADTIFIGLPTMATANAMYKRLVQCRERLFAPGESPSFVLAHGSRRLHREFQSSILSPIPVPRGEYGSGEETGATQCTAWLADNNKKSLLGSVGVGTVDQAVMGVLPVPHQSMRLLGLCRSVLIVDEVHAYDEYLTRLLEGVIEFQAMMGGTTILLSATLPGRLKIKLVERFDHGAGEILSARSPDSSYPLATVAVRGGVSESPLAVRAGVSKTVRVDLTARVEDAVEGLANTALAGGCACWVRNTVDDALEAYAQLSGLVGPDKLTLFHARMAMGDRLEVESEALSVFGPDGGPEERNGRILVATQVVEQSLDLDFDFMVSDLCPADLIIQRAVSQSRR